jgi:hypothetical protein
MAEGLHDGSLDDEKETDASEGPRRHLEVNRGYVELASARFAAASIEERHLP